MNGENGLSLLVQKFKFKEAFQPPIEYQPNLSKNHWNTLYLLFCY